METGGISEVAHGSENLEWEETSDTAFTGRVPTIFMWNTVRVDQRMGAMLEDDLYLCRPFGRPFFCCRLYVR